MISLDWLASLGSVILINFVLSGDNAIVIGLAAAGLAPVMRRKAIVVGIVLATVVRIALSLVTFNLLKIVGLMLAGGLLLAWVCWKMWREIRNQANERKVILEAAGGEAADESLPGPQPKTFREALIAIIIADVSMGLDNVLAVAGASRDHWDVLVIGLGLSIALMALAAEIMARLLERYNWLAYIGLAFVAMVAGHMIWRGSNEVAAAVGGTL